MTGQTVILSTRAARERAHALIDAAPERAVVNIAAARRTSAQNDKMWAMLSDISQAKPEGRVLTTDKWKALFMDAIGIPADWEPGINGGVVNVGYRSSRLSVAQMSDMIEQMQAYGAEHGVEFTDPEARMVA